MCKNDIKDVQKDFIFYKIFCKKLFSELEAVMISVQFLIYGRTDSLVHRNSWSVKKRKIFILYYAQSNLGIFLRVWQFVVVFFALLKIVCKKFQI